MALPFVVSSSLSFNLKLVVFFVLVLRFSPRFGHKLSFFVPVFATNDVFEK